MKKLNKAVNLVLAVMLLVSSLAGCGAEKTSGDGNVSLRVGNWPDKTQAKDLETKELQLAKMNEKYPEIEIIPDTYKYDTKTFTLKASANQLPDIYNTWFTETNMLIEQGYAADITDALIEHKLIDAINPELLEMVKDENGRIYGIPTEAYAQGLLINKSLFREAGLVNEDGSIKVPDTYQELAEYSKIINEKTGAAGLILPTTENYGGWHFVNIAWSYGVNFMEQNKDGKWIATFNTPEAVAALQYVKDLKWKYNALHANNTINGGDTYRLWGIGQGAMLISTPINNVKSYEMENDDVMMVKLPAGPKGRYAQMGGSVYMFAPDSTPEQIDAGIKWLGVCGMGAEFDEASVESRVASYKTQAEQGYIITGKTAMPVWVSEERIKRGEEIAAPFVNVDMKNYESYFGFEGVTIRAEDPKCCQQLYSVLDKCIQEVITNENADCAALIEQACSDFQLNHLDKED